MHQNVTVAQAIVASCHRFDGPRRRIVMSDLEFPSNMYLFEGFRRYGAESATCASDDGIRTNLDRLLEAIDERTALVPVSLVLFKSSFVENAAAIVEKAHRVGARVMLDVYQAAGTVPVAPGGARRRLCRRRIGQMAVRRARRRLSVRPPRSRARACSPASSGGPLTLARFSSRPGRSNTRMRPSAFRAARPTCRRCIRCRAGYEIVRRDRRRCDSREVACG